MSLQGWIDWLIYQWNKGLVANPDFWVANDNGERVIVGEAKSTHNLPLPMTAGTVVRQYNDAFNNRNNDPSPRQIRAWSHVGHPTSQLVGYMILNSCRFGLLTSATRTYFVHIYRSGNGEDVVTISNAWFVGQPNYLRAIAAFYHLANTDNSPSLSRTRRRGWLTTTPPSMKQARNRKRARDGTETDPGRMHTRSKGLDEMDEVLPNFDIDEANLEGSCPITRVEFDEVELTSPLGFGKWGAHFEQNGEAKLSL